MLAFAGLSLARAAVFKFDAQPRVRHSFAMAQQFVGKWQLIESENFDEYMKHVGVGFVTRKLGNTAKPLMQITVDGDHWRLHSSTALKTSICEFDLNKEFDETTADGRVMRSIFTLEGDKLIQVQKKIKDSDKDSRLVRYIEGDRLITEIESDGIKSRRIYQKQ